MPVPDYQGGSIVNLMASIIQARGGASDYPPLRLLPPGEISGFTNIVLLVLDGLGADWLAKRSPGGLLSRHLRGAITSVFPPTTASAITSFLTGDAPQQHAVTGWHTYLRELGCVMTVLPGTPRYGGVGYRRAQIDPVRLFGHRPIFDRIATRSIAVSPTHIARSDFNLAHLGGAELLSFATLPEMFRRTSRALASSREPKYLYLYWPELDSIGHRQGIGSPAAETHIREIESALADFMAGAAGTDTLLLITADHGQIDTCDADRIDLADHPQLAGCLTLPLCGESRAAFCYVRPNRVGLFEAYCQRRLSHALEVWPSRELVERGLFGLGPPSPRLGERIGDYVLIMKGNHVIREWLPFEGPYELIGVHGGLSEAELMVPLCVLRI